MVSLIKRLLVRPSSFILHPSEFVLAVLGWLLLLSPIANPDLPWHLSAGRRILELKSLPAADWLSWTRPGALWVDPEWGVQLLYQACWSLGGTLGLFALKAAVLAALMLVFLRLLRALDIPPAGRGAAAAALGACLALSADLRPDHFSFLFFTLQLTLLAPKGARHLMAGSGPAAHALMYAAWANLHPGFLMGLALLALRARWMWLAAGLLGTLLNPYGWRVYQVLAFHVRETRLLKAILFEWRGADPTMLLHQPFWLLIAFAALVLWRTRHRILWSQWLPPVCFGLAAVFQNRHIPYFALSVLPAAGAALRDRPRFPAAIRKGGLALGAVLWGLFAWARVSDGLGRALIDMRFYPEGLAAFLGEQAEPLGGLRLFHPYPWGGYLGWRLHPDYKVYWDGRYLFTDLLPEAVAAEAGADSWARFLRARDIELAALARGRLGMMDFRVQGGPVVMRPAERRFMDPQRWALVYWDEQALLFVRRDRADPEWLAENEYRLIFPDDQAWLRAEVRSRRLAVEAVAEEVRRYLEGPGDEAEKRRWEAFLETFD